MNWAAIIWLVLMIVFLAAETVTVSLVSLWFACGALGAMLISLLNWPVWLQILVFFVISGILLALLRPMVKKYIKPKIVRTNVDSVVGCTGMVTETIDNVAAKGQVKLGHMFWTARSTSGEIIAENTLIHVDRIEGVKVFVSPAEVPAKL